MKIIRSFAELHQFEAADIVYTIGNFDGLHLGHRKIIDKLVSLAKKKSAFACVVSFIRHTSSLFADQDEVLRLLDNEERASILEEWGVDLLLEIDFDDFLVSLSATQFLDLLALHRTNLYFVVGQDFCFGQGKSGNVAFIKRYLDAEERVFVVPDLQLHGDRISSTRIRALLDQGQVSLVAQLMGRVYAVRGAHVAGHRIGRRLGFPTINLSGVSAYLPGDGVYKTETKIAGVLYKSMTYIGARPTFDGEERVFETNLFDYEGASPLGERVAVYFCRFLRGDCKFKSEQALICQLEKDKKAALME